MAWVPLFLLWLGIGESSKIFLIALGAFFPVYLNLMNGVRNVDRKLVEAGLANGFRACESGRPSGGAVDGAVIVEWTTHSTIAA
jgi:sulfonate transport system permease protein